MDKKSLYVFMLFVLPGAIFESFYRDLILAGQEAENEGAMMEDAEKGRKGLSAGGRHLLQDI